MGKRLGQIMIFVLLGSVLINSEYLRIRMERHLLSDIEIEVGTPSKKIKVGLIWSKGLQLFCGKNDKNIYNPEESSSMTRVPCNTTDIKCENACSLTNKKEQCVVSKKDNIMMFADVLKFERGQKIKAHFICVDKIQDYQVTQYGALGIGQLLQDSPITNWFLASRNREPVMTVCYDQNGGGYFQLGIDPSIKEEKGLTLYYSKKYIGYIFYLEEIVFGEQTLFPPKYNNEKGKQKKMLVQIGSPFEDYSVLPQQMYQKIVSQTLRRCLLNKNCKPFKNEGCLILKNGKQYLNELDSTFPNFEIKIRGKKLTWLPRDYFAIVKGKLCITFTKRKSPVVSMASFLLRNKKVVVNYQKTSLTIFDDQKCQLATGSDIKTQVQEKSRLGQQVQGKQIVRDNKKGRKIEKEDEILEQESEKKKDKTSVQSKRFKYFFVLFIIILLVLLFCGGKIYRFCKLKIKFSANQLKEQGEEAIGNGSQMSVK